MDDDDNLVSTETQSFIQSVLLFLFPPGDLIQVGRPQCQIVTQQLHNRGWVTILILFEGVQVGNGIIEGLLGELAGDVRTGQDLIVKDRVVECQAQSDGVRGFERLGFSDGLTIAILGLLDDLFSPI